MYNIRLACRVFIAGFILLLSSVAVESAMPCHHLDGHECDLVPVMRPVAAFYTFEMGSSELVDTYLTPLNWIGHQIWWAMLICGILARVSLGVCIGDGVCHTE